MVSNTVLDPYSMDKESRILYLLVCSAGEIKSFGLGMSISSDILVEGYCVHCGCSLGFCQLLARLYILNCKLTCIVSMSSASCFLASASTSACMFSQI